VDENFLDATNALSGFFNVDRCNVSECLGFWNKFDIDEFKVKLTVKNYLSRRKLESIGLTFQNSTFEAEIRESFPQ